LAGADSLLLKGIQVVVAVRKPIAATETSSQKHPFWTGVVLSGGNPYFLIWWATVGLALATDAVELGIVAFALFAVIHWLCDLVWLEVLSLTSYKGTQVFGDRIQQTVLVVCGALLVFFGGKFLYDAGIALLSQKEVKKVTVTKFGEPEGAGQNYCVSRPERCFPRSAAFHVVGRPLNGLLGDENATSHDSSRDAMRRG